MRHIIGQFILIAGMMRKMLRQQTSGFFDAVDNSLREFRFPEIFHHGIPHLIPERVTAFGVHGAVANHRKLMHPRRHEDEHAIAVPCFIHLQVEERGLRRRYRVFDFLAADEHADLAGRLALGLVNGRDDVIVLKFA